MKHIFLLLTLFFSMMVPAQASTMIIDGKFYTLPNDKNIFINGNKVTMGGKEVTLPEVGPITIIVEGNVRELRCDSCQTVQVKGDVGSLTSSSANVGVTGNVTGGIKTMSGDVTVNGNVNGNIQTVSGDIDHR